MDDKTESSAMLGILRRGYRTVFFENWPVMLGGILIGVMSVITFAWARPWGVAGGLRNWGTGSSALWASMTRGPFHPSSPPTPF